MSSDLDQERRDHIIRTRLPSAEEAKLRRWVRGCGLVREYLYGHHCEQSYGVASWITITCILVMYCNFKAYKEMDSCAQTLKLVAYSRSNYMTVFNFKYCLHNMYSLWSRCGGGGGYCLVTLNAMMPTPSLLCVCVPVSAPSLYPVFPPEKY